jgi:hypothetical protein
MPTIFFDTQIWNYLVAHDDYSDDQLLKARGRLVEGVQRGEWEIVCCLPVLQELLATYRKLPAKYEAIKALLFEVVQNWWLKEIKERYVLELYSGGRLAPAGCYLDRELRRKVAALSNKKKDVVEINEVTHQEGLAYKAQQEDARKKVFTYLGSSDGKAPKKIAQAYEKWFANDRDLQGWVLKVLEGGVKRRLFPASKLKDFKPSYATVPSAWQYVDFRQAKILLNLGHLRAIKDSDAVDADIYGCSPYFDILVTEDQPFRDAIELIVDDRFELYCFKQLMSMLI